MERLLEAIGAGVVVGTILWLPFMIGYWIICKKIDDIEKKWKNK